LITCKSNTRRQETLETKYVEQKPFSEVDSHSNDQEIPRPSFQDFAAVKFQVDVFWIVMACSVVVGYQHFRGPRCFHLQGGDGGSMDL
jgi:hypothetical protein